ncbi:F-box/LRR-repeat protein 20-like [Sycon ciliatum]|uniref:F-box/LRR-repeat protein 20-like n=1 Tax=Sycon ciliatum TaxID=27933 RepID=UPI0031F69405
MQSTSDLETLQLVNTRNISDDVLCLILRHCRSLTVLQLKDNHIGPEVIDSLLDSCPPRLTELSLPKGSPLLLNEHVAECVAQSCPLLEKVNLSWHTNIGNAAVRSLLLLCPMLRILEVKGVKQLTSDPFLPLAVVCKTSDSVEDEAVLDSEMMALVKHNQQYYVRRSTVYGRNLQLLDLRFCDHVDVEHLMTIARATFQSLNVRHFKFDKVTEGGDVEWQLAVAR